MHFSCVSLLYFGLICTLQCQASSQPITRQGDPPHEPEFRYFVRLGRAAPANGATRPHTPRPRRQVVQPTWLTQNDGVNLFADRRVKVTTKNLQEAAAIRESIQEAVDEGRYDFESGQPEATHSATPPSPATRPSNMPLHFPWPPAQGGQPPQAHNFMDRLQRMWLEFLENSRKWFSSN